MIYQKRYLKHQKSKKRILKQIIKDRHSDRRFGDGEVTAQEITEILSSIGYSPSSCNRKAVRVEIISDRDKKALLGGILVGGVGWINWADKILLLFADPKAYKAEGELEFMPYLDAGVIVGYLYLIIADLLLAGCFVNPNIREMNKEHFKKIFGKDLFCGAFAVGRKYGK